MKNKKSHPVVSPDDGRVSQPHMYKGFTVSRDNRRGYWRAYVCMEDVEVYAGSTQTFRGAITIGVSAAHRAGTLRWKAAVAWARNHGINLSYDDVFEKERYRYQKGFYVAKNGSTPSAPRYEVYIGPSKKESQIVGSVKDVRSGVELGIKMSIDKPYYHEYSVIEWLRRKGMEDLIPMAKKSQVAA